MVIVKFILKWGTILTENLYSYLTFVQKITEHKFWGDGGTWQLPATPITDQ